MDEKCQNGSMLFFDKSPDKIQYQYDTRDEDKAANLFVVVYFVMPFDGKCKTDKRMMERLEDMFFMFHILRK
jgi:hypothetical protein